MNTLTEEQKTALLESAAAIQVFTDGKPVQLRHKDYRGTAVHWADGDRVIFDLSTFDYRPKPEPRKRLWNCAADVPMPGPVWVREKKDTKTFTKWLVVGLGSTGIACTQNVHYTWRGIAEASLEYSLTGKPDDWRSCEVEEG